MMSRTPAEPLLGWPEVAILPVTYRCNAHCDMCSLGDQEPIQGIGDDRLVELFADSAIADTLRAVNFTGGEPTMRADLATFVSRIVGVAPHLESISVNSNGMLPRSAHRILEVLQVARDHGLKLYVFISLDGIGELHDEIRGTPGAFAAAVQTIDRILAESTTPSELRLGISATATSKSIDHLDQVLHFAVSRDLLVGFTYPLVTGTYMRNLDRQHRFEPDAELRARFADFLGGLDPYSHLLSPPLDYYRDLAKIMHGDPRTSPCILRRGGFFIEPNGDLRPCWRSTDLLFGNVTHDHFSELWSGPDRQRILGSMETEYCRSCPSPCYVGFASTLYEID